MQRPEGEVLGGEVWVDVPAGLAFALRGVTPNPVSGPLRVEFSLRTGASAQLELIDVAGRILRSRDLADFGPGEHVVTFDTDRAHPGVYFLRLIQGAQTQVRRAVRIE
jgi:hypothetical protein